VIPGSRRGWSHAFTARMMSPGRRSRHFME
jgi:hypothetical protein